jgi:DNA helicase HerA-like ATPase
MNDQPLFQFGVGGEEGYGEIYALPDFQTLSPRLCLGVVIGGSLTRGLEVRLESDTPVEQMAVGRYVTIDGEQSRFFGMITDVELRSAINQVLSSPPQDEFTRRVLHGTAVFAVLKVSLMLRVDLIANAQPQPVKTVPGHFAGVRDASQAEIEQIFGGEDSDHFVIGSPLDMDVNVCLDYQRFIERSNGVFGKTGTGKTFLTRMILLDLIQKSGEQRERSKRCVNLVFDMHNDYGWEGQSEGASRRTPGLKQLAGSQVLLMTLDEDNARRRSVRPDGAVTIAYGDVEPGDIEILQETLNLTTNAVEATHQLARKYGDRQWLSQALKLDENDEETARMLSGLGIHASTMLNLRRGLQKLTRNEFMVEKSNSDTPQRLIEHLLGGRNVVLEFGRYGGQISSYMLVANILTRRIYNEFRNKTESATGGEDQPNHLVITIEEAHKFLSPSVAGQTIFGEIAREMRKYNVTLMVIDQRPSAIDDEVMSQIGTRLVCLLDNERDVDAVLSGISGRSELRSVLAKLDSRQQALILGHAVPMPVVVRTPDWDEKARGYEGFRASLGAPGAAARASELLYND